MMIDESSAVVLTADESSSNGVFPVRDWNDLLMLTFAAGHCLNCYDQTVVGLKSRNLAVRSNGFVGKLHYAFGQNLSRFYGAPPTAFVSF